MSTIQIRVDEKTKKSAKRILDGVGLDMSSAITVYLKQIIIHKGIPLKLVTGNGLSPEEETRINQAAKEARKNKNITKAMSIRDAIKYLKQL